MAPESVERILGDRAYSKRKVEQHLVEMEKQKQNMWCYFKTKRIVIDLSFKERKKKHLSVASRRTNNHSILHSQYRLPRYHSMRNAKKSQITSINNSTKIPACYYEFCKLKKNIKVWGVSVRPEFTQKKQQKDKKTKKQSSNNKKSLTPLDVSSAI